MLGGGGGWMENFVFIEVFALLQRLNVVTSISLSYIRILEYTKDFTAKQEIVILDISRKLAKDSEIVINDEENGCSFKPERKKTRIHTQHAWFI